MANIKLNKIFNKEFNESLVHQVATDYLSNQSDQALKPKRIAQLLVVVVLNQDLKKVQVEQELEQQEVLYGEVVVSHLRLQPKNLQQKD